VSFRELLWVLVLLSMGYTGIYPMHNNTNAHSSSRKDTGKYRYQLLDKQNF
jgi:hypothetical protein